jgi:hypothetical protein
MEYIESTSSSTQYGAVAVPDCGIDDVRFQPIMFWFFHRMDDDIQVFIYFSPIWEFLDLFRARAQTPQGASVFCNPTIKALNVIAKVDLNDRSIIDVTSLDSVTTSNNVTGPELNGQAFNR